MAFLKILKLARERESYGYYVPTDGSMEIVPQRIYAYNECMSQWLYCIYPWLGGKHNITERARHPEDVLRSGGALKLDVEWYLALQVCNHCNVYATVQNKYQTDKQFPGGRFGTSPSFSFDSLLSPSLGTFVGRGGATMASIDCAATAAQRGIARRPGAPMGEIYRPRC